jgi:L-aminopeptidase/D-esterase-like protein
MTNARLNKLETYRLAQNAHDGMAIAIRPAHMDHEGDTAFALATEQVEAPFAQVASAATEMVAEAIRSAVRKAHSVAPVPGLAGALNSNPWGDDTVRTDRHE